MLEAGSGRILRRRILVSMDVAISLRFLTRFDRVKWVDLALRCGQCLFDGTWRRRCRSSSNPDQSQTMFSTVCTRCACSKGCWNDAGPALRFSLRRPYVPTDSTVVQKLLPAFSANDLMVDSSLTREQCRSFLCVTCLLCKRLEAKEALVPHDGRASRKSNRWEASLR